MYALIEFRRSTSAEWAAYNPVLGPGEPGIDTTNDILKIGDGVSAWADLPVFATGQVTTGGGGGTVLWTDIANKPTEFNPIAHGHVSTDISDIQERIQDVLAATIIAGTGITVSYNDTLGTYTITATGAGGTTDTEVVRDTIGSALVGSGLIQVTVNDAADTITITTTATQNQTDAYLLNRANQSGSQSADTIVDGTTNKTFTAANQTKLTGIATGATANQTDAYLLSRTNHTGTQLAATISDFNTAVNTLVAAFTKKVVTFPTGSEPTLSGVPDGTLWVEYTP